MINLKRVQLKAEYKLWQVMTYGKVQFMPADKFNGVLYNFLLKNLANPPNPLPNEEGSLGTVWFFSKQTSAAKISFWGRGNDLVLQSWRGRGI